MIRLVASLRGPQERQVSRGCVKRRAADQKGTTSDLDVIRRSIRHCLLDKSARNHSHLHSYEYARTATATTNAAIDTTSRPTFNISTTETTD